MLIANTSSFAGRARATVYFEDGTPPLTKTFALPATSRVNVVVGGPEVADPGDPTLAAEGSGFGELTMAHRRFGVVVESVAVGPQAPEIVVERAMYQSPAPGPLFFSGTNCLATKLQ